MTPRPSLINGKGGYEVRCEASSPAVNVGSLACPPRRATAVLIYGAAIRNSCKPLKTQLDDYLRSTVKGGALDVTGIVATLGGDLFEKFLARRETGRRDRKLPFDAVCDLIGHPVTDVGSKRVATIQK